MAREIAFLSFSLFLFSFLLKTKYSRLDHEGEEVRYANRLPPRGTMTLTLQGHGKEKRMKLARTQRVE